MKNKQKEKRIKIDKYESEDQIEIKRFIRILIIIIIFVIAVYFLSRIFVSKDLFNKENNNDTPITGSINYNTTLIGNMFNKSSEEYYVLMYDTNDLQAAYYSGFISNYNRNENALDIYFANLSNPLNKTFVTENADEVNVNTTDFAKFKVGNIALLKISDGKISEALTDSEAIATALEYKKSTK